MNFFTSTESCRATLCFALLAAVGSPAHGQVDVTTYKYNAARTGANTQETALTPATVTGGGFHKIFTTPLDGYVYAEPLYISGLWGVAGGSFLKLYNVVFAATEHDSIFALDANSTNPAGSILWHRNYLPAGEVPVSAPADVLGCTAITPEVGITGTPVIDPLTSTMYFVTTSKKPDKTIVQRLHAVSVLDGSERFGSPVVITAQTHGSALPFDPRYQLNRPALLLDGGRVVIGWASYCDLGPYNGWLMSYDAFTLKQLAAFNTTPNDQRGEGGIWMCGGGIAADDRHRLFFPTGNGDYDPTSQDYGDSILRLDPQLNGGLTVGDWFTPMNQALLDYADGDLGSGGLILLPDLPAGSKHPHLLVQMGKSGIMYLVDRDNMGKYCNGCTQENQIVQAVNDGLAAWATPAYWNGTIYWASGIQTIGYANGRAMEAWSFNAGGSGLISTAPVSQTTKIFTYSTAAPVVSADGNKNGIVWVVDNSNFAASPPGPQVLYAYDATDLTKLLYTSEQAVGGRDRPGGSLKFAGPIVANGRVFSGGAGSLSAWGLNTTCQPIFFGLPCN